MLIFQIAAGIMLGGVLLLLLPLLLPFAFLIGMVGLFLCAFAFILGLGLALFAGSGLMLLPLALVFLFYVALGRGSRLTRVIDFFFTPTGRLARLDYAMPMALFWVILCIVGKFGGLNAAEPAAVFLIFPSVCLGVRRWHDFNCRGWWWLLRFAPLPLFVAAPMYLTYLLVQLAPLAVLVVECLIPGNKTANRFGPVPFGFAARFKSRRRAAPTPAAVPAKAKVGTKPQAKSRKKK